MKENNNILNEKSNVTFYNEQDEKELLCVDLNQSSK